MLTPVTANDWGLPFWNAVYIRIGRSIQTAFKVLTGTSLLCFAVMFGGFCEPYKQGTASKHWGQAPPNIQDFADSQDCQTPEGCQNGRVSFIWIGELLAISQTYIAAFPAVHTNAYQLLVHLFACHTSSWHRVVEDYGVIYLGSAIFKIARLLFVAMFSVHLFACVFFRVKASSASTPEDVTAFYFSKNVADNVREKSETIIFAKFQLL